MVNRQKFDNFLSSLKQTNQKLDFFVDFNKCSKNLKKISVHLNTLNYLLGKNDLKQEIDFLYSQNKECFSVLNLLIAVRDKNIFILDDNNEICSLKSYFENSNKIYKFMCETGLRDIFINQNIKNLSDYVFGIEAGLDTNARKNRSGKSFENLISRKFDNEKINYRKEVKSVEFIDLNLGSDLKRFDFVINTKNKIYFIETNFYNLGGSKLNEVARSYIEINAKISLNNKYGFVWVTDGRGWLSAKNKLEEAYKSIEIYNLSNLNIFIEKIKNEM
ncbi:type II restriction endonuclease [Campylobacter portucalensis]|uniref:type II restriction endonuclease n=1 Tax=Campylobacter portucalensis TaxID=2608384 RepID=UPI003898F198